MQACLYTRTSLVNQEIKPHASLFQKPIRLATELCFGYQYTKSLFNLNGKQALWIKISF